MFFLNHGFETNFAKINMKPSTFPTHMARPSWPLILLRSTVSRKTGTKRPKPEVKAVAASSLKELLLNMVVLKNGA